MTENIVTTNTLSDEIKTYYEKRLIDLSEPKLVHDQFGDKYPIPPNSGKSIEFRKFDSLDKALTPLTEGVTPSGSSLNVSAVTATVNQYGDYVQMSDVLDLTAVDPVVVQATRQLAAQAGRTLDTVVREELSGGTNVMYAPKSDGTPVQFRKDVDQSCKLTPDLIFKAAAQLKRMNAEPIDDSFVAIVHPSVAYDLMRNEEWIDVHKYASPENIYKGEIGKLGGVRFVETTEAKIWKGKDLSPASRTLLVNAQGGLTNATEVPFDGGQVEEGALVGRYVLINSIKSKVLNNTASKLTLETPVTCSDNEVIYPGEGASCGGAVYSTLILGQNAYGVTEVTGGGLTHIVKQKGYGDDPLNQRSAVGWKATKAVKRLVEQYMVRVESSSSFGNLDSAN